MITQVYNLATGEHKDYATIPAEMAVVAAYAQFTMKDWNTGDYAGKYNHLIVQGEVSVSIGDWSVMKYSGEEGKEAVRKFWQKQPKAPKSEMWKGVWIL